MKMLLAVAVIVAFALVGVAQAAGVKIVAEAEHYRTVVNSMAPRADSTASGGKCIERPLKRPHATTETGPSDTGHADYAVYLPYDGTYQFWARCWWTDACGNSFYILIDNYKVTSSTPYVTDQSYQKWHWVAGPSKELKAGWHTIRVQYREDGTRMDEFLFTNTPRSRWEPTGVQAETPDYVAKPGQ